MPFAGARLRILVPPGLSQGLAFCRYGPLWRRRGTDADLANYRQAVTALVDEYCARRGHYLTLAPRPNPDFYPHETAILAELGFTVRRPFVDKQRYFVNLTLDPQEQLRSFSKRWRYNLNLSLRHDIAFRLCERSEDVDVFFRMYERMRARKGLYPNAPVHLVKTLRAHLPAGLHPHIVLGFYNDRAIVGAIVSILGDTAYFDFGGGNDEALPLEAGYALQWWIIRWLAGRGLRWYDLGGEGGTYGLMHFKKGFAGKQGAAVALTGEYDRWTHPRARVTADLIYLARAARRGLRALVYSR
jgi:hypothetical protein